MRAFLRIMASPVQPMDSTTIYRPRVALYALVSAGIILLEVIYFSEVPYDQIPGKTAFLLSLIAWGAPPVIVEWAYVRLPTRRELNAYFNMMIVIGLLGIAVATTARSVEFLVPVALALMPGAMAGGLLGSDTTLLWRLYKIRRSGKLSGKAVKSYAEKQDLEQQRLL